MPWVAGAGHGLPHRLRHPRDGRGIERAEVQIKPRVHRNRCQRFTATHAGHGDSHTMRLRVAQLRDGGHRGRCGVHGIGGGESAHGCPGPSYEIRQTGGTRCHDAPRACLRGHPAQSPHAALGRAAWPARRGSVVHRADCRVPLSPTVATNSMASVPSSGSDASARTWAILTNAANPHRHQCPAAARATLLRATLEACRDHRRYQGAPSPPRGRRAHRRVSCVNRSWSRGNHVSRGVLTNLRHACAAQCRTDGSGALVFLSSRRGNRRQRDLPLQRHVGHARKPDG